MGILRTLVFRETVIHKERIQCFEDPYYIYFSKCLQVLIFDRQH